MTPFVTVSPPPADCAQIIADWAGDLASNGIASFLKWFEKVKGRVAPSPCSSPREGSPVGRPTLKVYRKVDRGGSGPAEGPEETQEELEVWLHLNRLQMNVK
jgi:hypothetical protein